MEGEPRLRKASDLPVSQVKSWDSNLAHVGPLLDSMHQPWIHCRLEVPLNQTSLWILGERLEGAPRGEERGFRAVRSGGHRGRQREAVAALWL